MNDLCHLSLNENLDVHTLRLAIAAVAGGLGIWGWGFVLETCLPRYFKQWSFSSSYILGSILVSLFMLAHTLLDSVLNPERMGVSLFPYAIAASGILFGVWLLRFKIKSGEFKASEWLQSLSLPDILLILAIIPLSAHIFYFPTSFSDTTSIWAFHGKALACENLWNAHFIRERIWTGTHPEYPLFFPLNHAYLFTLMNSFRDDWVKFWQALFLAASVWICHRNVSGVTDSKWIGFVFSIAFLSIFGTRIADGKVELLTACLTALILSSLISKRYGFLSICLFALAFTKNEGLASAIVFSGLWVLTGIAAYGYRDYIKNQARYLISGLSLIAIWLLLVGHKLPSYHEQYPTRLLSLSVWQTGLEHWQLIFFNCGRMLMSFPWLIGSLSIIVGLVFIFIYTPRLFKNKPAPRYPELAISVLWPLAMLGIFACIYVVTPGGPTLYQSTFDRLLTQIYPAIYLGLIVSLGITLKSFPQKTTSSFAYLILGLILLATGPSLAKKDFHYAKIIGGNIKKSIGGFRGYSAEPAWSLALRLDKELPLNSKGMLLNETSHYAINYMLYPRRFYLTYPNLVACTYEDFTSWTSPDDITSQEMSDYNFKFVYDAKAQKVLEHG